MSFTHLFPPGHPRFSDGNLGIGKGKSSIPAGSVRIHCQRNNAGKGGGQLG
jgi:hypothetical protein